MRLLVNENGIVDEALQEVMEKAAALCVSGEGLDPGSVEISLSFVSAEDIHELNRQYRGVDRVTDVLSFPLIDDWDEIPALEEDDEEYLADDGDAAPSPDDEEIPASEEDDEEYLADDGELDPGIPLGDVVICLDKAEEQAAEFGHSREREIVYLFVHSVLHLLGYDHMEEEEKREMRQREEEVMRAVDLQR